MPRFYAVVATYESRNRNLELRRLNVDESDRAELADSFQRDASKFRQPNLEIVSFQASHPKAADGQLLVSRDFQLPETFVEDVAHPDRCERIDAANLNDRSVTAILAAYPSDDGGVRQVIFKEMRGAKILDTTAMRLFLRNDTLKKDDEPGLVVPNQVHAVYEDGDLFFESYTITRRFLDLDQIFRETSRQDIENFLDQAPVVFRGDDHLYDVADVGTRRRLSSVLADRFWTRVSMATVRHEASKLNINVSLDNGNRAIVLPNDRQELNRLARFLNQDIFETMLTKDFMQAESKTQFDQT